MYDYVVDALIEIPLGSNQKYEYDEKTGRLRLDRVLYSAMNYPTEYGVIEETLAPDGDPVDILVVGTHPTFPGCIVPARVLGYLPMIDGGQTDYKIISVVDCDPRYADVHGLHDLPNFLLDEIKNFFESYKVLQNIEVTVDDYRSAKEAEDIIDECRERYQEKLYR